MCFKYLETKCVSKGSKVYGYSVIASRGSKLSGVWKPSFDMLEENFPCIKSKVRIFIILN
jgi:hypothetical protein